MKNLLCKICNGWTSYSLDKVYFFSYVFWFQIYWLFERFCWIFAYLCNILLQKLFVLFCCYFVCITSLACRYQKFWWGVYTWGIFLHLLLIVFSGIAYFKGLTILYKSFANFLPWPGRYLDMKPNFSRKSALSSLLPW